MFFYGKVDVFKIMFFWYDFIVGFYNIIYNCMIIISDWNKNEGKYIYVIIVRCIFSLSCGYWDKIIGCYNF